jgi:hypothetical protein
MFHQSEPEGWEGSQVGNQKEKKVLSPKMLNTSIEITIPKHWYMVNDT